MPKLEYPATFDNGLLGMRCKEHIHHREACLAVPLKLTFSVDKARKHDVLSSIIAQHKDIFNSYEDLILALALVYEMNLGEKSFWFTYIQILP